MSRSNIAPVVIHGPRTIGGWRRWLLVSSLLTAFAFVAESSSAAGSSGASSPGREAAALFRTFEAPGQPGCAIGVSRKGALVHRSGHGTANLERGGAIDADTIFNIASTSKQFTAFSIYLLETRGKLSVEDSVARHLPELSHYAGPLKIRHLISHTGAVRDYSLILRLGGRAEHDVVTERDILQAFARQRALNAEPGEEYDYSNSGYSLLAMIVERVSGQQFQEFVKANIFDPLGMTSSSIGRPDQPRAAAGYRPESDGTFHELPSRWHQAGESDLHTTVNDLLRWSENFRSAKVGGKDVIARMLRVGELNSGERLDYAGGLMIGEYGGLPVVTHSGFSVGFRSQLMRFPRQQLDIAVLCNRMDAEPERDAERIADIFLAGKLGERSLASGLEGMLVPGATDPTLAPAGSYRNPRTGAYVHLIREGGRTLLRVGEHTAALRRVRDNLYAGQLQGNDRYVTALPGVAAGKARLLLRLYGKPAEYVLVDTWTPDNAAQYVGTYRSEELGATYRLAKSRDSLVLDMGSNMLALQPGMRGEFEGADARSVRVPEQGADHFIFSIPELRGVRFDRIPDAQAFASSRDFIHKILNETPTPSVAVAVVRDGRILWEEGFGWADRERKIPATAQTMYSLASTSKPITATGLMTLVRSGQVDLDRPANDYLGSAKLIARVGDARDVTVRRLASHSSGLGRHFQYFLANERWRRPPMDVTIRRYGNVVTLPGERYTYSNLNTSLLDYIVERASGRRFDEYMQREVFEPLGMTRTAVNVGQTPDARWAVRYDQANRPLPPYVSDTPGAADIYSSAHDLARFGLFHLQSALPDQKRILPAALIDAMHEPGIRASEDRAYGLGWHIQDRCDGYHSVYHGGGLAGSSTLLLLVPKERLAVVVLINRFSRGGGRELVTEISNHIVNSLLPGWKACEAATKPADEPLTGFAGTWAGSVHTERAELPLTLRFLPSGEVRARLAKQSETVLKDVRLSGGWLQGSMSGAIGTEDTGRYGPNTLDFTLKLRDADVLNGSVTAGSEHERPDLAGMTMTLSHWVQLKKQPLEAAASVLIKNAQLVDGTGTPARRADVRLRGDRIAEVGELRAEKGEAVVDARGLVLAPGFIDTHSHHERGMEDEPQMLGAVSQGITTIIVGQDGYSLPLEELARQMARVPVALNVGTYVGHNIVRKEVMGEDFKRHARADEIETMRKRIRQQMLAGALGLSSGLEYDPGVYSSRDEVITLAREAAAHHGRYSTHMRSEDRQLWDALDEVIDIGRVTGMPVHVSHMKLAMVDWWGQASKFLARMDEARAQGVRISGDVYPYEYWQSGLTVLFPDRDFDNRRAAEFAFRSIAPADAVRLSSFTPDPSLVGHTMTEIAKMRGTDPETALMALIRESDGAGGIIATSMRTDDIQALIAWPHANICTDGSLGDRHPRGAGSMTRVLRQYVREQPVLTLEQAVHKLSALAADNVGIVDRGVIRPGMYADLVLFDPKTVSDRATLENSGALSVGIEQVWVNGQRVFESGRATDNRPGRLIRRPGTPTPQADAPRIAGIFADLDRSERPGCAVGVMRDGKLIHASGHGYADLDRHERIAPDTVFNIASTSKQFTAFSLLLLQSQGKLSLDDSIVAHIPELGEYARPVTLRHLLHHTGGLRDYERLLFMRGRTMSDAVTKQETLDVLARQRAANAPAGTKYEYSNTGYFLLGIVVERVSGASLASFAEKNIFSPLGMHSTRIVDRYPAHIAALARGYSPAQAHAGAFEVDESLWQQTGDGQVHTTVEDLVRWSENFHSAKLGGPAIIHQMLSPGVLASGEPINYAAGLRSGIYRGLPVIHHTGGWAGYRSQLLRFPEQHFAVAVLCNRLDGDPDRRAKEIAEIYLGERMQPDSASPLPSAVSRAADVGVVPLGLYRNEAGMYLRLRRNGGTFVVAEGTREATLNRAASGDQIFVANLQYGERRVQFFPANGKLPARLVVQSSAGSEEYALVQEWRPGDLKRYAGTYQSEEAGVTYRLVLRDGGLALDMKSQVVALQGGIRGELAGLGGLLLAVPPTGAVDQFTLQQWGVRNLVFRRIDDRAQRRTNI